VRTIGKYEVLGELGRGAMGVVYKARHPKINMMVALKTITTSVADNPDLLQRFYREGQALGALQHPNIATIYDMGDEGGLPFIAMEYVDGQSLGEVIARRLPIPLSLKLEYGIQACRAFDYAHKRGIIHRDIKPSNILLCKNGQVKLCDFGVSGEFGTKGDANTFIGTSYYMAPERITGQSYTITSDVWSTGVTLLEVAQHRFPFPADGTEMQPRAGLIDLLTYIVRQPIPKLRDEEERGIRWSDSFKYFIECCLEKEPSRRASPWRMLEHPWMIEMRGKRVNMAHFLAKVWGWNEE